MSILKTLFLLVVVYSCQPLLGQEKFEPITTKNYTDTNYQKNLDKSKIQRERLSAQPFAPEKIDAATQLKRYKLALEKYPIGSMERAIIEEKILKTQESLEH